MTQNTLIAYADCFSGISGDMFLGALLHVGLEESLLRSELAKLRLKDCNFEIESASRQSIACRKVEISSTRRQELRTLSSILQILDGSGLDDTICVKSAAVFTALAKAEATVHGVGIEKVHFHEVGAIDTIIDIVGSVIGLHQLGVSKLVCSPLPMPGGFVDCTHGRLPLPAPAACELLRDVPGYGVDIRQELVTPTGAALIKVLADSYGPMPPMSITATGYGAGNHSLPGDQPNLMRLLLGRSFEPVEAQMVTVIETRLDDWNPEGFPYLCSQLNDARALDVSLSHCQGKKGRPGFMLQVICQPAHSPPLQDLILSETTAIGLRYRQEQRRTLPREIVTLDTQWGAIEAKKVETPRGSVIYPEYEECLKIARKNTVTLDEVYRAVYIHGSKI